MSEDLIAFLILIFFAALIVIAILLWIKTLFAIIKSNNIRIVKIIYFFLIIFFPIIGVLYPLIPLLSKAAKKDLEGAPERLKKAGGISSSFLKWLFGN